MTKVHELKADPAPFNDVLAGTKRCEVRRDDRGFGIGHILHLREFDRDLQEYSGRECWRVVTHIQTGYGLPDGLVVLSIMPTVCPSLAAQEPRDAA
jgi:hypothetical protein